MLSMGHWARSLAIKEVCKTLPIPKLLIDAGCGDCSYSLSIRANRKVGLDLNPPLGEKIETIRCDIRFIPLKDAVADCVVSLDVIEHVAEDDRVVGEFYRILGDDGTLILTTPNESEFIPNRILRRALKMETKALHREWRHLRVYSENQLISLVERHGFRVTLTKDSYQPLARLLEPANWCCGLRARLHMPVKSSMDRDFSSRRTKLVTILGRVHDPLFKLTLAPLVKWIERKDDGGFVHFLVSKK